MGNFIKWNKATYEIWIKIYNILIANKHYLKLLAEQLKIQKNKK